MKGSRSRCKFNTAANVQLSVDEDYFSVFFTFGTMYSRMDHVRFVKDRILKIWSDMVCLNSLLLIILSHYVTLKDSLPWLQTVLSMTIISYKFFCCGWGKIFSKQCFQGVFKKSCCASFKNFNLKFRKFFRKYMLGS